MIARGAFCFEWILEKEQLSRDRRDVKRKATQIYGKNGKEWKEGMNRAEPKGKKDGWNVESGLGYKEA